MKKKDFLIKRAKEIIPGGVNSAARKVEPFNLWKKAKGAYLWDIEGKKYTDYHGAWGPIILGHNYSCVDNKVKKSIGKIDLVGMGVTEIEIEFAERIIKHLPGADKVLATTSGSEATYHAIRVSRAYTKKQKIIKFQGCFHGWHDYLLLNILSKPEKIYRYDPGSAGMLKEVANKTLICRLNDINNVKETCEKHKGEIAAIIIEPVAYNIGSVMLSNSFLKGLRKICNEQNIVLIFDEVVTGFRLGLGGYQSIVGITPDLTTLVL